MQFMKYRNFTENVSKIEDKVIRIKVPASVAFDLKKMNKVTGLVLAELGCPACHSGHDLRFDFEREFIFNEKINMINRF